MSLILDALRKSDAERQRRATDTLRTGPGPARAEGPPAWLWWLLGAATLVSTATAVWLALRPVQATDAGQPARIMENRTPAEVRPLAQELAVRAQQVPATTPPAQSETGATAESAQITETAPPAEIPMQATPLSAMPAEFRAGLPPLEINAHAWAEQPEQRFVLINLRRYAEGDTLREGPKLLRIEADGVILEYRGERFSLPRQ